MKHFFSLAIALVCLLTGCSKSGGFFRETGCLNGEWRFSVDSISVDPTAFDMGRAVDVPHTWNLEEDLQEHFGEGWYARGFDVPAGWNGKRIEIFFDAVYHDAWVYVNGQFAGDHIGSGYNRFGFDISGLVTVGGTNTLVVKASNAFSRENIPFVQSFDWNNDGGIIRDVTLQATNQAAVKRVKISGSPDLSTGNSGTAYVNVELYNEASAITMKGEIREWKTGASVWAGNLEKNNIIKVDDIAFWHFDSPTLYTLTVDVYENGNHTDQYITRFGFRSIEMSSTHFILNGEPVRLMGVEWMPGSSMVNGMAETKDELIANLKLMKEANCVYSRFHWQQDNAIYDYCDENGILYQEEVPVWGGDTEFTDTITNLGIKHLTEMIEQRYNHPSIIAWGIGNELRSSDADVLSSLSKWREYAQQMDPTRLVFYVSNRINNHKKDNPGMADDAGYTLSDVILFNEYYSTWYGQSVAAVPAALDRIHSDYPDKALVLSEWGICEPPHLGGDPRRVQEMQKQIVIYGQKPYVAGAIYFSLNDYRTFIGPEFGIESKRVHGTVDVRMNKKPSYDVLKKISSPLEASEISTFGDKKQLMLTAKTGIPSYILRNYTVKYGTQEYLIKELKPGESLTLQFDADSNASAFTVYRPTGFEVITVEE